MASASPVARRRRAGRCSRRGQCRSPIFRPPLFVGLRDRHLEIEVPLEHATDVWCCAGHLERLDQELGLLFLGDVLAVLVAQRRQLVGAVAKLGQPDLLGPVAVLDHDVAVLANAREGEEAVVAVEATGQAALGVGGRAIRRVRKATRVRREGVEVARHLAAIDGVQLLKVAQVVDDRARNVGASWARRAGSPALTPA